RTEGLPHVVLEAMAARTPVVATRVGGTPEVVKDGVNGLLVPAEDPGALAEAVSKLWSDAALADRLRQGGLSTLDRFSWQHLVDEYDAALMNVVLKND
ncbi:MAG TPA: glycosyltransferase family 4 protein, partial [Anaerolineales bacterium]|nr:glycosyltransferase family 4 protein [Anaerolineales bacterium]